ncbi:F-box domain-containing protein [Mycena kentingensis (nom. inval.)]|nr:F-box domain-containing protein [Mycena kentingensis (nom. inval.)]
MSSFMNAAIRDHATRIRRTLDEKRASLVAGRALNAELRSLGEIIGTKDPVLAFASIPAEMRDFLATLGPPQLAALVDAIPSFIDETEPRLAETENEVARLEAELRPLQVHLDALVYPVLTLPPEITSEIFLCLVDEDRAAAAVAHPANAPLLLLRVCRAWRDIALQTPRLWRVFKLAVSSLDAHRRLPRLAELMDAWFTRARSCGLFVQLWDEGKHLLPSASFDVLRKHAENILELDITGFFVQKQVPDAPFDFSRLRVLEFTPDSAGEVGIFSAAPQLRSVSLNAVPLDSLGLPWTQLSRFSAEQYSTINCFEALCRLEHADICEFQILSEAGEDDIDDLLPTNLVLPNLIDLALQHPRSFLGVFTSLSLLDRIETPSLKSCEIVGIGDAQRDVLSSFLQQASSLKDLCLYCTIGRGPNVFQSPEIFAPLKIEELTLRDASTTCAILFFDLLGNPGFLPTLQGIAFSGYHRPDAVPEFIGAVSEALELREQRRGANVVRLRVATIVCSAMEMGVRYDIPAEFLAPLKKLKEEGLLIEIGSQYGEYIIV